MKLNKAQLAALAQGASQAEIAALATASDPVAASADDAAATAAAAAAAAAAGAPGEGNAPAAAPAGEGAAAPAAAAAAAAPAAPALAAADQTALVAHLNGQLVEKDAALIAAKVEVEGLKAQVASVDGLVAALRTVLGEKLVALGASADAAAGFTATNIAAEFTRIDAVHKAQFRVGGVAAVASPEDRTQAVVDPMVAARFQNSAVR